MISVRLIHAHSSLTDGWAAAAARLRTQNIDLQVVGQDAVIDWAAYAKDELQRADIAIAEVSGHHPNATLIIEACSQARWHRIQRYDQPAAVDIDLARLNSYVHAGTPEDLENGILSLLQAAGLRNEAPAVPSQPRLVGIAIPGSAVIAENLADYEAWFSKNTDQQPPRPIVAILIARQTWLDRDEAWLSIAIEELKIAGLLGVPIFSDWQLASHLGADDNPLRQLLESLCVDNRLAVLWNSLLSHSAGDMGENSPFARFGVPVQQLVRSYTQTAQEWRNDPDGLSAMSVTYNIVQPELLGAIEPTVFAGARREASPVGPPVATNTRTRCDPLSEQIAWLARRAATWSRLRHRPNSEKRLAVFLHHGPCTSVEATLTTAAGIDAAESCVRLLRRLSEEGYQVDSIPADGKALIEQFLARRAINEFRWTNTGMIVQRGGALSLVGEKDYRRRFDALPDSLKSEMEQGWGTFPGQAMVHRDETGTPHLVVSGLRFGNIVVLIDPKRGCWGAKCDGEVCRILHQSDIPPPHHWLATFWWCQDQVDALISLGTEWPMEFLPGKRTGLSTSCWAGVSLGHLPVLYPYICDATGEALLAKRRGHAVLVDHLPAAIASVGAEDDAFARLMDLHRQYQQVAGGNDAARQKVLDRDLRAKAIEHGLFAEPETVKSETPDPWPAIRDDLPRRIRRLSQRRCRRLAHTLGEIPGVEQQELYGAMLSRCGEANPPGQLPLTALLEKTHQELTHLVEALSGRFVPPGPGGSLERGRRDVLPTGRNPFGIDLRRIPTEAAQSVGKAMGEMLLRRHLAEEGRFPERIGITIWSSDAFQSEGELCSQILWLLGCQIKRDASGRVLGPEVIPLDLLTMRDLQRREVARPRCDVVVQMSGVVRDTLPGIWLLIDEAVQQVVELDEEDARNRVRAHRDKRLQSLRDQLVDQDDAVLKRLASARVFSSKPGTYGTGVELAVDAAAWENDSDLAEAYVNWTGWAYGKGLDGRHAAIGAKQGLAEYASLLAGVDVSFQKAIGPEYDSLSIGCYAAFQGGMSATTRAKGGLGPKAYWGAADGDEVSVRDLGEEIDEAVAARLASSTWLEDRKADGYQGAAEIAHLVNTLFRWSATTHLVKTRNFDQVLRRLIENEAMQAWLERTNPYAFETITRKLMEAAERGLWQAKEDQRALLQSAVLRVEGAIEGEMGEVSGEIQGNRIDVKTRDAVEAWKYDFTL